MATRYYLPSTGAADVSPAFDGWSSTVGADRIKCVTTKIASASTDKAGSNSVSSGNLQLLNRQYVSASIGAQTITGTVKGQVRSLETNPSDDMRANISIRVVSSDGSTFRGTLLAIDTTTGASPTSEFVASLTNRKYPWVSTSSTLSSVTAQENDRIVIEIGCSRNFVSTRNATHNFGDVDASDLPEDETTTTANNPWIEFSMTLAAPGSSLGPPIRVVSQAIKRASSF